MLLKIEFEEQVWAQIIDMLADQPYKRAGAVINTMAQQIQDQRPEGKGNGRSEPIVASKKPETKSSELRN